MKLTNLFSWLLAPVVMSAIGTVPVSAQTESEEPIITFHTTVYENTAEENAFHIVLGAKEEMYVDIDFGYGPIEQLIEQAVYNPDTQSIDGTWISGSVSKEGIVKIYGDPTLIDYIDMNGCYITDISFPKLTEVEIIDMSYNNLTALDLSHMKKLQAIYLTGNPFNEKPLVLGADKPDLTILEMSIVDNLDPEFDIKGYPSLVSFEAWHTPGLTHVDPTGCPELMRLSIDITGVSELDVTKNPKLLILNIGQTKISSIDLSNNPYLTEFYCNNDGTLFGDYKFSELDLSHNTELQRLACGYNNLTTLDVSKNTKLTYLAAQDNYLTELDLSNNPLISDLHVDNNCMTFATLPADRNTFNDYYYSQRPLTVDRSYPVGNELDFSAALTRPGSETVAVMCVYDVANPSEITTLDEGEYFTYDGGKINLIKETPDSVYMMFMNSALSVYPMRTGRFMVKTADDFGKDNAVASVNFSSLRKNLALSVGIAGAAPESPKTFSVDFGDGTLHTFTATGSTFPAEPNVTGQRAGAVTTIYLHEGDDITAFGVSGGRVISCDLSNASSLIDLRIIDAMMPSVDLSWNTCLQYLDVSGNNLESLDLTGANGLLEKANLGTVIAKGNRLTSYVQSMRTQMLTLDLSDNSFTDFDLSKFNALETLDLSGNSLSEVNLQDLEAIKSINLSDNNLTGITLMPYGTLESLDITRNDITIPALPAVGSVPEYLYAPQNPVLVPVKAPTANLTSEYFVDSEGRATEYVWYTVDGNRQLGEEDVTGHDGRFKFVNPDAGLLYCAISHPAFPDFAGENVIRTTNIETAPVPTHVFASFTTVGSAEGNIILAGRQKNTTVYIDWTGDGDLEQYVLTDSYSTFPIETFAGAQVKCYSYEEDDEVTLFSLSGVKMSAFDASPMKGLVAFTCAYAGLTQDDIKLPASPGLQELTLSGNNLSALPDLSAYPEIWLYNVSGNSQLTSVDISGMNKLQAFYASSCRISDVKFDNPAMWEISLMDNNLSEIDLTGAEAVSQLWLSHNNLSEIDLSPLAGLKAMALDYNNFTIATLPLPTPEYIMYLYTNQSPIEITPVDGTVDLSEQAVREGVETQYTWYIDTPYFDENNELVGEDLYIDDEYTLSNGVTTFLTAQKNVMCVMTNSLFPDLYLYTTFIDTYAAGIDDVTVDSDDAEAEYYNLQGIRVDNPSNGVYIKRQGNKATKVVIR